jgi:hypothetical protein
MFPGEDEAIRPSVNKRILEMYIGWLVIWRSLSLLKDYPNNAKAYYLTNIK